MAVQLTAEIDFDHPSCWSDDNTIYIGWTTLCRVDSTTCFATTARFSVIRGVPACLLSGVWIATRAVVLGFTPLDLTVYRVEHIDGNTSNARRSNLRVVRARLCGPVRSCLMRSTARGRARLKIRIHGQVSRTPVLDSDTNLWTTLGRLLSQVPPSTWNDDRDNILGLES